MVGKGCIYSGQRYFPDTDVKMYVCYYPDPENGEQGFSWVGSSEPFYCLEEPERCPWRQGKTVCTQEICECCG